MPVDVWFRRPGAPGSDWSEQVAWPDARIPVAGEMVDLPDHGQVVVESVQWFITDESGPPSVQLMVR